MCLECVCVCVCVDDIRRLPCVSPAAVGRLRALEQNGQFNLHNIAILRLCFPCSLDAGASKRIVASTYVRLCVSMCVCVQTCGPHSASGQRAAARAPASERVVYLYGHSQSRVCSRASASMQMRTHSLNGCEWFRALFIRLLLVLQRSGRACRPVWSDCEWLICVRTCAVRACVRACVQLWN